jgi:hypothetical protein
MRGKFDPEHFGIERSVVAYKSAPAHPHAKVRFFQSKKPTSVVESYKTGHEADITRPRCPYLGKGGKHLFALSFSAFELKQTLRLRTSRSDFDPRVRPLKPAGGDGKISAAYRLRTVLQRLPSMR